MNTTRSYRLTRSMWMTFGILALLIVSLVPAQQAFYDGNVALIWGVLAALLVVGSIGCLFAYLASRAEEQERSTR